MDPNKTRPNLSFVTSRKFSGMDDVVNFAQEIDDDQAKAFERMMNGIPELIQFAEMLHDKLESNPDGIEFKAVNNFLNSLKPE